MVTNIFRFLHYFIYTIVHITIYIKIDRIDILLHDTITELTFSVGPSLVVLLKTASDSGSRPIIDGLWLKPLVIRPTDREKQVIIASSYHWWFISDGFYLKPPLILSWSIRGLNRH